MGIAMLKKLNTCTPDALKKIVAPFIQANLIYNNDGSIICKVFINRKCP